ncbi:hypothetical protein [Brevibacillus sp. NRS-1366]|uniref:hypothetical protein n=1 Tax=Brevibacillus sp. NRS-1366 TaxID=3233899 RepID=UPI003D2381A1
MKYGLVYLIGGDWGIVTDEPISGGNFAARDFINALNFVAADGWEFVSQIDHRESDNGIAYVVKKSRTHDLFTWPLNEINRFQYNNK